MAALASQTGPPVLRILVGGYDGVVTTLSFDPQRRSLEKVAETASGALGAAPSWLHLDTATSTLYSADEVDNYEGASGSGGVYSASLSASGHITPISSAATGAGPVSVDLSVDGKSLAVASYSSGSLWQYQVSDRRISPKPTNVLRFDGKGPNAERQDHSYAHQVRYDPTGKLAFVCDLGADVVRVFQAGAEGVLAEVEPAKLPPGSGPRHLDFYVDKVHGTTYVYVISELNNTLTTMTLDYNTPRLTSHQTVSILADNVKDPTTWGGSEVVVSPDGRFVYAGNRQTAPDAPEDDNTVAVLRRNDQDGRLSDKRVQPLGGRLPRHFALDPSGRYLVVGAQGSDRVLVHERDEQTGQIRELARTTLPKPAVQIFA